ncbi:MAG: hypothetical protein WBM86_31150 [Waterburya sp.]
MSSFEDVIPIRGQVPPFEGQATKMGQVPEWVQANSELQTP